MMWLQCQTFGTFDIQAHTTPGVFNNDCVIVKCAKWRLKRIECWSLTAQTKMYMTWHIAGMGGST